MRGIGLLDSAAIAQRNAARDDADARERRRRAVSQKLRDETLEFDLTPDPTPEGELVARQMAREEESLASLLAEAGRREAARRAAQGKG